MKRAGNLKREVQIVSLYGECISILVTVNIKITRVKEIFFQHYIYLICVFIYLFDILSFFNSLSF